MNPQEQNIIEEEQSEQQGEIINQSSSLQEGEIHQNEDQIYQSGSSQDDDIRIQQEKKRRQDFWKQRNDTKIQHPTNQKDLLQYAFQAAAKTNKRMLVLRKRNQKRVQQLDRLRMMQQTYLMPNNTHFRGSINQYPILTQDWTGKVYSHANNSLRVSQSKLDHFVQKNIAEENTSNYLNEVVKFQNFAYQHRKKRRQNFQ